MAKEFFPEFTKKHLDFQFCIGEKEISKREGPWGELDLGLLGGEVGLERRLKRCDASQTKSFSQGDLFK